MGRIFRLVKKPGKKISLETAKHPCPKCKHKASVQLIRSEKQFVLFNVCISNVMRVRYECANCTWRNEELPVNYQEVHYKNIITSKASYFIDYKSVTVSY